MTDYERERNNVGSGWHPIVDRLHADLDALMPGHEVLQIKEKFGLLRYYFAAPVGTTYEVREQARALTIRAEEASGTVCEICGDPGEMRGNGWLRTLCDEHDRLRKGRQGPWALKKRT